MTISWKAEKCFQLINYGNEIDNTEKVLGYGNDSPDYITQMYFFLVISKQLSHSTIIYNLLMKLHFPFHSLPISFFFVSLNYLIDFAEIKTKEKERNGL